MTSSASEAVRWARTALAAGASPESEARTLVAYVLGVDPGRLPFASAPDPAEWEALREAVARRQAGEPIQHITGVAHFRRVSVAVGPGVFVPRPETEAMTQWCLDRLAERRTPAAVVELCAGSGAISLALAEEAPGHRQWAVELSEEAMPYLARNLRSTDVVVVAGDMADALGDLDGQVDVVVANPPYVPLDAWESVPADVLDHDPAMAVFSGTDGLDALKVLADTAARLLRTGGLLAVEHAEVQHEAVVDWYAGHGGFHRVRDHRDLTDRWRFLTATRL